MAKPKLPSTAVGRRRLLKLADLLMADAKKKNGIKFDLGDWGTINEPEKPLSCGTTACAMGLAALSGAFSKSGLSYKIDNERKIDIKFNNRGWAMPAAANLFQISKSEAEFLFANFCDLEACTGARGERSIAKRIRDFVAGRVSP